MSETEQIILQAFTELLKEMPFQKITVKAVIDRCGIARSTFYYYFADLTALLNAYIRNTIPFSFESLPFSSYFGTLLDRLLQQKTLIIELRTSDFSGGLYDQLHALCETALEHYLPDFIPSHSETTPCRECLLFVKYMCGFTMAGFLWQWISGGMEIPSGPLTAMLEQALIVSAKSAAKVYRAPEMDAELRQIEALRGTAEKKCRNKKSPEKEKHNEN